MFLFVNDMFLVVNDMFLFGNDMFLFGNDMFLFETDKFLSGSICFCSETFALPGPGVECVGTPGCGGAALPGPGDSVREALLGVVEQGVGETICRSEAWWWRINQRGPNLVLYLLRDTPPSHPIPRERELMYDDGG